MDLVQSASAMMTTTTLVNPHNCQQMQTTAPPPEIRIEVADNLASSPFIDRFFNSAVVILTMLLLSGAFWVLSKLIPATASIYLEEIALVSFTLTLIAFAILGLTAMCVVCTTTEDFDDGSFRRKQHEMLPRSNSLDGERSCDTVCETSSAL